MFITCSEHGYLFERSWHSPELTTRASSWTSCKPSTLEVQLGMPNLQGLAAKNVQLAGNNFCSTFHLRDLESMLIARLQVLLLETRQPLPRSGFQATAHNTPCKHRREHVPSLYLRQASTCRYEGISWCLCVHVHDILCSRNFPEKLFAKLMQHPWKMKS